MSLPGFPSRALVAALLLPAFASSTVWADIGASNLTDTLDALSGDTSAGAVSSNVGILLGKIDSLNAQIREDQASLARMSSSNLNYTMLKSQIAQEQAVTSALQRIVSRLQDGYVISSYSVSTDAGDQSTTADITFSKTITGSNGTTTTSTLTLTEAIPAITIPDEAPDSAGSSSGSSSDSADMLTQILEQFAMQLAGQQTGAGGNPLASIQSTLNNLVNGNAPLDAMAQCSPNSNAKPGNGVAVYDISAGKVYMPDGTVLEAHSGMGAMMDNPAYANQRMNGPTPPNTYNLSMRESPYYGVQALRMTPTDAGSMYGRDGILAHSKLVRGANNGSHGCVAFADYAKFLAAYQAGQVRQLVVVPKMTDAAAQSLCRPPEYNTANPTSMTPNKN